MAGTKFMENREPNPRLRKYMLTYNLYQVVLNAWCVVGLVWEAFKHPNPFHFTVEESSYQLTFLIWVHYNNKFIELFDTTFMVFNKKKKQVSFLHVYHHVLIMWSWYAVCVWGCGGIAWFSAMMNSLIHVVMYGYYTLAALKLPCPWKKNITQMQLGQFVLCMTSAVYAMSSGIYPFYLSCLNIWVMLNMLVLFWQFFKQAYAAKKPAPVKDAVKEAINQAVINGTEAFCGHGHSVAAGGEKKTN
jgi:elongation of very long chain fatty acids protein 4